MNPPNPAKFGAAFAAGLVVALAGSMIYVNMSGLHGREATGAATAQTVKQPESLNAGKIDQPPAVQAPKPEQSPPATEAPAPAATPTPAVRQKAEVRPAARPIRSTQAARKHYPPHTLPESQSTIRVEISQIQPTTERVHPPSAIPIAGAPIGQPVSTVQPVNPVKEEQQAVVAPNDAPPSGAPAPQPHTVTLQAGTNLLVRLGETLSTDHNYSGDTFRATLDRPVILDGFVIADKGSKVLGKIVAADKAGKFEGVSSLQLALTEINTTDGQHVRIETGFFNKKGSTNNGQEVAKIGGGAVLGAIIGAVAGGGKGAAIGAGAGGAVGAGTVMLGKGRPAIIPSETQMTFQLSNPTTITERLN